MYYLKSFYLRLNFLREDHAHDKRSIKNTVLTVFGEIDEIPGDPAFSATNFQMQITYYSTV